MDKEIGLLSRVAANHLFLAQFEALRATLLSIRKRKPDLSLGFLRTVVAAGGRFPGVLWSSTCDSPSHLAWLAVIELLSFRSNSSGWSFDPELLLLQAEFLLLVETARSRVSEASAQGEASAGDHDPLMVLNRVLDVGLRRLRKYVADDPRGDNDGDSPPITEEQMRSLWRVFLDQAELFDAISMNITKQVRCLEPLDQTGLAVSVRTEFKDSSSLLVDELEILVMIRRSVQLAQLDALMMHVENGDMDGALSCLRFLHPDHGLDVAAAAEHRNILLGLIKMTCIQSDRYCESWHASREKMLLLYAKTLSTGCPQLVQTVQAIEDELYSKEIENYRATNVTGVPLPIHKFLKTLTLECTNSNAELRQNVAVKFCMRELYHYSRISGTHILECILDTALSAVRRECFREASDVLSLFPLLQPLAAVLGWDILHGKTSARRKLMQFLWTTKSQVLRLEESPIYEKQSDEVSCVEYLCDLLCFQLDLARFVACVNSGRPWNSKISLLLSQREHLSVGNNDDDLDPFVENFILERLAVQTPMRVLFDVVPDIRYQDAIEIIGLQPLLSSSAGRKRLHDIELMNMRYALESAVRALGIMEHYKEEDKEFKIQTAIWFLKELKSHMDAIYNIPRKIFTVSFLISLLHMDDIAVDLAHSSPSPSFDLKEGDSSRSGEWTDMMVCYFTGMLLDILQNNLLDIEQSSNMGITTAGKQALDWRLSNARNFIEDWKWRLSILQRLQPLSGHVWSWKEALVILRAAPSKLLNLCMQRAKYDIGEEAVHRFSLPPEDRAALELAEWVAGAFRRASVEDAVSRAVEGTSNSTYELDISSFRQQLGPLPTILLCVDVASASSRSVETCKFLLKNARSMLSEIYPGNSPKVGSMYWEQIQEVATISVIRRILQRLHDLLEQDEASALQDIFNEEKTMYPSLEPSKQEQRQRALVILHQMIDDAHCGKRQFLSGKLHNLARALVDEDSVGNHLKGDGFYSQKKTVSRTEKGVVVGLGLRAPRGALLSSASADSGMEPASYDMKDAGKRIFGALTPKSSTYLSSFVIYIATIGDVVDGTDTTHDFNFFSLIYEWPKELITRLVFERGSSDAAGKVAEIMGADFVHEIISSCVPPVLPPRSGHGWACIPAMHALSAIRSQNKLPLAKAGSCGLLPVLGSTLYPLQLNIVKHLAKLSPVRAVLACVFGSSILSSGSEVCASSSSNDSSTQAPDTERLFYEFALDQSERFPTLNRWIQMQSNLHRVSESTMATGSNSEVSLTKPETKFSPKRLRDPESDNESEVDDVVSSHDTLISPDFNTHSHVFSESWQGSPKKDNLELDSAHFITYDWENEGPYERAVERLISEGKLMDALALSDRCLRNGASDRLLQLLVERGEEHDFIFGQLQSHRTHSFGSNSWQYCLRLRDKKLAAELALKYLHSWDLEAAMDVLTMCSCHLSQSEPIKDKVLHMKRALQRYNHILCADDRYSCWQEVEADCKEDPEGLALKLAAKGAVSAALEVAESASLSLELRRELQGRQLVKLLTADPLSGGGPAEASRFLSSLRDSDDALPVAIGAMQLLPDLRSKQLLVHFFLKQRVGNLTEVEVTRLNSWATGLRVLALLPLPWQQRCSSLHEHPTLILEVLLMMKQIQSASLVLREFPLLRDNVMIYSYAAKAISVNAALVPREQRISLSGSRPKQKTRSGAQSRSNFTQSINNLQREARRAFSWTSRDAGNRIIPKDSQRKRKSSGLLSSEKVHLEAMRGIQEEHVSVTSADGQERLPFVPVSEEWMLTGDAKKDEAVRMSHRYETSPDFTLFKALISLCSDDLVSSKGIIEMCTTKMRDVLRSQYMPLNASVETLARAYHATETYVQALTYAKGLLRKSSGTGDSPSSSEKVKDVDESSTESSSSGFENQYPGEPAELLSQASIWLGHAELLQSLLGSGIAASLEDISDAESAALLRDRLIKDERYSMAIYTSKKCKIDAFPVWNAWGHALIRIEHYSQARVKFKQALQLHKGDSSAVILEIVNTIEGCPPSDISIARSMYEHLEKNVPIILDDSLSADSYLNVLHMPSTFPRSEKFRRSQEVANGNSASASLDFDDSPRSHLDNVRYVECIHYLQEYARPHLPTFMFKHGHYMDACLLFFPLNTTSGATLAAPSAPPHRLDALATDYGTIDDLCDMCIVYEAMGVLGDVLSSRIISDDSQDSTFSQVTAAVLTRICNYCETHRHFNYLYKFQVIRGDNVAAGLCCIQLFIISSSSEEAIKHLENARIHFEDGVSSRQSVGEATKVYKFVRGKSASERLTEEGLVKFSARVAIQVDVVKSFSDTNRPLWKLSLFGNPNDTETFRRRCEIAETLAERHFDLAFQIIYEFNLPAVDIYAVVAASLAERKKGSQLTEFFRNIKGTIDEDDWDQVLSAAINVYANRHKERPDRLIDMLISSHRKVLACVVCGRLKSAFQIASRSGSVADVQYVAHQALHANALPVLDMCKQWLAQYM